jgi:SAM-dependent methyltransferase
MNYIDIDRIYREVPLENIPWNSETPPDALVKLVKSGKVRPCRTIDLGCGAGHYALYLDGCGFDVTGVDSAPTAIKIARENAQKKGAGCRFIVADLIGDLHEISGTFDFAFDWEFLHHIVPEDRKKYIENVSRLLNPEASYLSVCFSERDPQFGGKGKYRKTRLGTTLYFSSESELSDLLSPYFTISELKTVEISGKYGPHCAVYIFSRRR